MFIIYVSELFKLDPNESYFGIIIACEEIPGSWKLCHTIPRSVYMHTSVYKQGISDIILVVCCINWYK